jgi:hypothetical protein
MKKGTLSICRIRSYYLKVIIFMTVICVIFIITAVLQAMKPNLRVEISRDSASIRQLCFIRKTAADCSLKKIDSMTLEKLVLPYLPTNITMLDLRYNYLGPNLPSHLFSNFTQLTVVHLEGNHIEYLSAHLQLPAHMKKCAYVGGLMSGFCPCDRWSAPELETNRMCSTPCTDSSKEIYVHGESVCAFKNFLGLPYVSKNIQVNEVRYQTRTIPNVALSRSTYVTLGSEFEKLEGKVLFSRSIDTIFLRPWRLEENVPTHKGQRTLALGRKWAINYVIAGFAGAGRRGIGEVVKQNEFLVTALRSLLRFEHSLTQVTIVKVEVRNSQASMPDFYLVDEEVKELENRGTKVVFFNETGAGISYGGWMNVHRAMGRNFDFSILVEDDYGPYTDHFDRKAIELFHGLLPDGRLGILSGMSEGRPLQPNSPYPLHPGVFFMADFLSMEKLFVAPVYSGDPYSALADYECFSKPGCDFATHAQVAMGELIRLAALEHVDVVSSGLYRAPVWTHNTMAVNSDNELVKISNSFCGMPDSPCSFGKIGAHEGAVMDYGRYFPDTVPVHRMLLVPVQIYFTRYYIRNCADYNGKFCYQYLTVTAQDCCKKFSPSFSLLPKWKVLDVMEGDPIRLKVGRSPETVKNAVKEYCATLNAAIIL